MKVKFTENGMFIDDNAIDTRFKMATESQSYAGCYISGNPEELPELIEIIESLLTNCFNNKYWGKHTKLVWEGQNYNVAYCDGVWIKGCSYSNRHTVPTSTTFPITKNKIVRLTIKAFDDPFISLEEISIPEEMLKYKEPDGNWVNDWE